MTGGAAFGPQLLAAASGAAASRVASAVLARRPPGGPQRWTRTNHRGRSVTLLEGPALVVGGLLALSMPVASGRQRAAGALALAAAGTLGALDDLAGAGTSKGLRGHLTALGRGEVTTGAVKIVGLALTGVLVTAVHEPSGRRAVDLLAGGAVVAGSANLVNLLDLRPGRALKAVLLCAAATRSPLSAVAGGAALGLLGDDLAERSMLGDTGANAAGALVGLALVAGSGPRRRWVALAALIALTLASERVSFSRVIDATPGLRELDQLGRRPLTSRS